MGRGHFIITTRLGNLGNIDFEKIEVCSLSSESSVQILSKQLYRGSLDEKESLANTFQRHAFKELKLLVNFLKNYRPEELGQLANFLKDYPIEELESLASFLQGHPLALHQSAEYISRYYSQYNDFIKNFSTVVGRDPKIKNIVNENIGHLSEESQYILKIACIGDFDNIPYDTLYHVFRYSHTHTSQEEFDRYLGEITRLSIMSIDTTKGILKMYRVIQQAYLFLFSRSIDDSLIQNYSNYLYEHYNPLIDDYTIQKIDHIKNLTLQAVRFLAQYKKENLSTGDILNYSKLAI